MKDMTIEELIQQLVKLDYSEVFLEKVKKYPYIDFFNLYEVLDILNFNIKKNT